MQKSHSFVNYKKQQHKLFIFNKVYIDKALLKSPVHDWYSQFKNYQKSQRRVQWLACNIKEQQNAAKGHT
jgi:hypothetical protein